MRCTAARITALLAAAAAAPAHADREVVTISIASPSQVSLELCQDLPVVGGCDTDSSPLVGTAVFLVDTDAGTTKLIDFVVSTTEPLDYTYTGLLSQIDATASVVDVFFDQPGPAGPVALGAGGAFSFPTVGTNLIGTAQATGTILAVGTVDETIDLADFGPFDAPFSGNLTNDGAGTYTLDAQFAFNEMTTGEVLGTTVTSTIIGTITLQGTGTASPACAADIDCDLDADPDDIQAFVNAFTDADPTNADIDGDGDEDPDDIQAFVDAFIAGC